MLNEMVVRRFAEQHQIALEIEDDGCGGKWFVFTIDGDEGKTVVRVRDRGADAYYWVLEIPHGASEVVRYCSYLTSSFLYPQPLKSFAELKRLLRQMAAA